MVLTGKVISRPLAMVIAAGCAVVGGVAGAFIEGSFDQTTQITVEETRVSGALELERLEFQSELILKAIDTGDQQAAIRTLRFFANAGLIPAFKSKVLDLTTLNDGSSIPTLRTSQGWYRTIREIVENSEVAELARAVGLFTWRGNGTCTAFLVSGARAIVPKFCLSNQQDTRNMGIRLHYDSEETTVANLEFSVIESLGAGVAVLKVNVPLDYRLPEVPLNVRPPVSGEELYMIHHPNVGPKKISESCFVNLKNPIMEASSEFVGQSGVGLNFTCWSEGGSAGGPVFAANDNALIGVHVAQTSGTSKSIAILMTEVLSANSTLP